MLLFPFMFLFLYGPLLSCMISTQTLNQLIMIERLVELRMELKDLWAKYESWPCAKLLFVCSIGLWCASFMFSWGFFLLSFFFSFRDNGVVLYVRLYKSSLIWIFPSHPLFFLRWKTLTNKHSARTLMGSNLLPRPLCR